MKEPEKVDFSVIDALNTYKSFTDELIVKISHSKKDYLLKHKYTSILDIPKPKAVQEALSNLQKYVGIEDPAIAEYYIYLIADCIIMSTAESVNNKIYFFRYDVIYNHLHVSGLNFMKLQNYDKILIDKGLLIQSSRGPGLVLATIKQCITENKKFDCGCIDISEFVNLLYNTFFEWTSARENESKSPWMLIDMFRGYENVFSQAPAVKELREIVTDDVERFCIYGVCLRYKFGGRRDIGTITRAIKASKGKYIVDTLIKQTGASICNFIKIENASTANDDTTLEFTDNGLTFFKERDLDISVYIENVSNTGNAEIIRAKDIKKKALFYSPTVTTQVTQIKDALKNLASLQKRLKSEGYNTGVNVLMYGLPGTGKTETAYQIAKEVKRDVYMVDMAATKSCWFGESEKIVKNIFKSYREMCSKSKPSDMPILLLNEADALLGKRKDVNTSNVAQTENAIQNIILQEMEVSNGIILATTNMVDNLDSAFERRFLFKIKFENPTIEAKKSIWASKMPKLEENEISRLAQDYNLSGGQIDNVCRKAIMNYITTGKKYDYDSINEFCKVECIQGENSSGKGRIGFI